MPISGVDLFGSGRMMAHVADPLPIEMQLCEIYAETRRPISDEMLLAALRAMGPPLLPSETMDALEQQLDRNRVRPRGRPVGDMPVRKMLAAIISSIERDDFPVAVRQCLAGRLASGRGLSEPKRSERLSERVKRQMVRRYQASVYRDVYDRLSNGCTQIKLPRYGLIEIDPDIVNYPRYERAAETAVKILREHNWEPPSALTLLNHVKRDQAR